MDAFIELFKLELAQRLSGIADGLAATKVRTHKSHSRTGKEYVVREHERAGGKKQKPPKKAKRGAIAPVADKRYQLQDLDPQTQREISAAWDHVSRLFPNVAAEMVTKVTSRMFSKGDQWAYAEADDSGRLMFNQGQLRNRKGFMAGLVDDDRTGGIPRGAGRRGWGYVMLHEFGHKVLDYANASDSRAHSAWARAWAKNRGRFCRNAQIDYDEGFADSFFAVVSGSKGNFVPAEFKQIIAGARKSIS